MELCLPLPCSWPWSGALQTALNDVAQQQLVKDFITHRAVVGSEAGFPAHGLSVDQQAAMQELIRFGWVRPGPAPDEMGSEQFQLTLLALQHLTVSQRVLVHIPSKPQANLTALFNL